MSAAFYGPYRICSTFVVAKPAVNVNTLPTIFRSYPIEGKRPDKCPIWQAARATSAAPSFFKEMYIDNPRPGVNYIDGGLGYNNPSELAWDEPRRIWPTNTRICLVSIGTGHQKALQIINTSNPDSDIENQRSLFRSLMTFIPHIVLFVPGWKTVKSFPRGVVALIKMASALSTLVTNSEDVHQRLQRTFRTTELYFRFNVERDVGDIGLGDWKMAEEIAVHTMAYLAEQEAEERKTTCAKYLLDPSVYIRKSPFLILTYRHKRPDCLTALPLFFLRPFSLGRIMHCTKPIIS